MTLSVGAAGRPRSRLHEIATRIAARLSPQVAAAFLDAIARLQRQIDEAALRSALASGNPDVVAAAIATGGNLATILLGGDALLERALLAASRAMGRAGADVLAGVTGLETSFNAMSPNVVLFAREQAAQLVVGVSEDVREAIRIVIALGEEQGLTVVQRAQAIREIVGLPPNWARAPLNLAQELREGRFTATRRLSATDKAQIRSRLAKGTVDDAFIARMQARYTASLINLRAKSISRTETARAVSHGQREQWRDAQAQGVLPDNVRRVVIVTPDERLRELHAAVPGMNPDGVKIGEPFTTPWGLLMGPPWDADPYNCRCSEGLIWPGLKGVL